MAEPIDYLLRRWPGFTRFLDEGRVCLTNNAAERALRGFALGRKAWLFAGSERGAAMATRLGSWVLINEDWYQFIDVEAARDRGQR